MSVDPKIYRNFVQATGSPSDPKATNVTEDWTVISLLKGIWDKLSTGITATISGVSTAANQTTANTSLGSIDTKLSSQATAANQSTELTRVGDVTEAAPASDTASSGLNGRLQRIAQRITSLIALVPAALTGSGNFKVAVQEALPAGEAHVGEVGGKTTVFDLTLSLDTSAYTAGDVMADTQQCDAFFRKTDGTGVLHSITVIDKDDQKIAFDIYIFSANRSLGTENSAPNISDANAADLLGIVSIAAADYKDLGGVSVACIKNIGLPVKAVSGTDDLYVGTVTGGTPTYTASGVVLRLGGLLD